jgi:hypothetical protein
MSKLHSENAGYVGCSYEETQDPYYSYNKLALPLVGSEKTVIRDEVTLTVTVAGGKFVIDGTSQASLTLKEGVVYKFDQSDNSNTGHPLRLSITSDGSHSRGTDYYRGVTYVGTPGTSGAYTELVVPFAGLDLYYYCGQHPNMGGSAATPANTGMHTRALPVLKTSDQFGAVVSSLNYNGYDIGVEQTTTEQIGNGPLSAINTSAAQLTYHSNKSGHHTLKVNFATPIANATGIKFRGGGYAVNAQYELRINGELIGSTRSTISGWGIETVTFSSRTVTSVSVTSVGNGYGFALGDVQLNVGGTYSHPSGTVGIAAYNGAKDPYARNLVLALPFNSTVNDYSDSVRGYGTKKDIQTFVGSTSGGAEISTAQSKYYGSSFYAVRGGVNSNQSDYVTRINDPDLSFNQGDFTVEFWFYPTSLVSNYVMFDNRHPTTGWPNSGNGFALIGNSSGTIHFYSSGSNVISADYAIQNQANTWHHIAVSRMDGRTSLFINGVRKGDVAEDDRDYNQNRFTLGSSSPNGEGVTAYFNDLRIYKGVAKYKPEQSGHVGFQAVSYEGIGSGINRIGANFFSNHSAVVGGSVADAYQAFNGSGANWANLTATNTSTAASVDFHFTYPIHGVTKIEAAFDSPSGAGDTRGRYNGANGGASRTGTGSGYSDIYSGSAITVSSVGFAINQNGATGTNNDIVSRFRVTDSSGTYILVNGQGSYIPFQPDLVWLKNDGSTTGHHCLYDSVRGVNKHFNTSNSSGQSTEAANRSLAKFNVDGFTIDTSGGEHVGPGNINVDDQAYIAYCWKAGGTATSVSAGSLTASSYNSNSTWSSGLAASQGFKSNLPATQAFDGDPTTRAGNDQSSGGGTLTLTVNINVSSQIRVLTGIQNDVTINGTSIGSAVADPAYVVSNGAKTVTEIVITAPNSNGYRADLFGIEVDGETLLDSGVSAPTVPTHASSLSAGPDTGFSIVKWTAASSPSVSRIPHGLSTPPKLIFVKGLNGSVGITAGHEDATWKKRLKLNDTISATTGTGFFNDSPPASKYFTLGSNNVSNDFIAYCFSDVENYQKISSYIGGGSNTVTVTTGFRPQWLLIKADIAGEDWVIMDDARSQQMPANEAFFANTGGVQQNSAYNVYFLDDGFRVHNNNPRFNTSGSTYYYMAIGGSKVADPKDSELKYVDKLDLNDLSGNNNNGSNSNSSFQTSIKKFYDGAAAFASGQYVTVPDSTELRVGTGDFTIEVWMHPTEYGSASYPSVISKYADSDLSWILRLHSSGQLVWYNGASAGTNSASASGLSLLNQWSHIAVARQNGVTKVYLNGSQVLSVADTYNYDDNNPIVLGRQDLSNNNPFIGYLQDFRLYKGIAKYTSSFSPPERSVQGTARRYPSGVYVVS